MTEPNKEAGAQGAGEEKTPSAATATAPEKKATPTSSNERSASIAKTESRESVEAKKPEPKTLGDDDEIPEDAELFTLSRQALQKRLNRHTKKEIRERFGTDDLDSIKAKLEKAEKYEQEQEKLRRAQLTREEKLKEDLAKERAEKSRIEAELREQRDRVEIREVDQTVRSLLPKFVDESEESIDFATYKLKQYVLSLDDDELEDPKKVVEQFAADFVKKYPKHARAGATPQEREVPLDNGARPNKPDPMKDGGAKDPRPGKQNSMTRAEYAAYKRRLGLAG